MLNIHDARKQKQIRQMMTGAGIIIFPDMVWWNTAVQKNQGWEGPYMIRIGNPMICIVFILSLTRTSVEFT